jgi:hypothetical protein
VVPRQIDLNIDEKPASAGFFVWRPGEKQQFDPYRQSTLDDDAHHPVVQIA